MICGVINGWKFVKNKPGNTEKTHKCAYCVKNTMKALSTLLWCLDHLGINITCGIWLLFYWLFYRFWYVSTCWQACPGLLLMWHVETRCDQFSQLEHDVPNKMHDQWSPVVYYSLIPTWDKLFTHRGINKMFNLITNDFENNYASHSNQQFARRAGNDTRISADKLITMT